jgi:hypothetical protein
LHSTIINGGLAGIIGGLIIGILSLFGVGVVTVVIGLLLVELGITIGAIGTLIVIFFTILAILVFGVLSAIGGAIGEYMQSTGKRQLEDY